MGWSPRFIFTAMRNGTDWSPSVAVFGDLGAENAMSLSQLQREAQQGNYDAVLHIGDFAYNLESVRKSSHHLISFVGSEIFVG